MKMWILWIIFTVCSISFFLYLQSVLVSGELSFSAPLWVEVILKTAIMFHIMTPFEWLLFTCFHIFVCVTPSFQCRCICDGIVHKDIIMDFVSPLSCSMTSGKSGLWCDANLSCLRISTPQKPWSPTAELKTCWLLTMDSRTLYLPASGSADPSTIHCYGHPFCPGVRVTLMSHAGPSIRVSDHEFTHNPHLSFILEATSLHICAFSGVLLYFVDPRHVQCVLPFLPMSLLLYPPCHPLCSLSVWNLDSSTLVLSFLLGIVFLIDWTM